MSRYSFAFYFREAIINVLFGFFLQLGVAHV